MRDLDTTVPTDSPPRDEVSAEVSRPAAAPWDDVHPGVPRWVVIDFDRLLAPFVSPQSDRVAPRVQRLLAALAATEGDHLVVHSASSLDRLRAFLRGLPAHRIGERGWEASDPIGRKVVHQLPARTERRLRQAAQAAEACGWRSHLERRRCSLRLSHGGLPPLRAQLLRDLGARLWSPEYETDGLRMAFDEGGLELHPVERSVATAIQEMVRRGHAAPVVVRVGIASSKLTGDVAGRAGQGHSGIAVPAVIDVELESAGELVHWLSQWTRRSRP